MIILKSLINSILNLCFDSLFVPHSHIDFSHRNIVDLEYAVLTSLVSGFNILAIKTDVPKSKLFEGCVSITL